MFAQLQYAASDIREDGGGLCHLPQIRRVVQVQLDALVVRGGVTQYPSVPRRLAGTGIEALIGAAHQRAARHHFRVKASIASRPVGMLPEEADPARDEDLNALITPRRTRSHGESRSD